MALGTADLITPERLFSLLFLLFLFLLPPRYPHGIRSVPLLDHSVVPPNIKEKRVLLRVRTKRANYEKNITVRIESGLKVIENGRKGGGWWV